MTGREISLLATMLQSRFAGFETPGKIPRLIEID
jgi:hypothetical protein